MADPTPSRTRRPKAVRGTERSAPPSIHPAAPYLYVLAVAGMASLILALYVWFHRAEIQRIINVSPV